MPDFYHVDVVCVRARACVCVSSPMKKLDCHKPALTAKNFLFNLFITVSPTCIDVAKKLGSHLCTHMNERAHIHSRAYIS